MSDSDAHRVENEAKRGGSGGAGGMPFGESGRGTALRIRWYLNPPPEEMRDQPWEAESKERRVSKTPCLNSFVTRGSI